MLHMLEEKDYIDDVLENPSTTTSRLRMYIRSRYGTGFLALISFLEGMLPIPVIADPFLIVAVLVNRVRVVRLVIITTASSVLGGLGAYLTAVYFRDWLLGNLSPEAVDTLNSFIGSSDGTFLLTLIGAFTPVPYTIAAWAVALSAGNIFIFIIASILGRGLRFAIVGWCTYVFGPAALQYAKRSILITSLGLIILVALYVWLKL